MPSSKHVQLFQRCAIRRLDDAAVLSKAEHLTGAVYLAGYGIECILKALILASVPAAGQIDVLNSFKGARAHNYEWLRTLYLQKGGARFPGHIVRKFTLVNAWSTDLRYNPGELVPSEADPFLEAAREIIGWAAGRI